MLVTGSAKFAVQLIGKFLFAVAVGIATTLAVDSIRKTRKRRTKK